MTRVRTGLIVLALCATLAAAATAATSGPAQPQTAGEIAVAEPAVPPGEAIVPEPVPMTDGIFCTFECNDGTGLGLQCGLPTLGQCCAQGQPACASHGGLEDGICRKGRLGLPCVPE
jgi:hypothetical protein